MFLVVFLLCFLSVKIEMNLQSLLFFLGVDVDVWVVVEVVVVDDCDFLFGDDRIVFFYCYVGDMSKEGVQIVFFFEQDY